MWVVRDILVLRDLILTKLFSAQPLRLSPMSRTRPRSIQRCNRLGRSPISVGQTIPMISLHDICPLFSWLGLSAGFFFIPFAWTLTGGRRFYGILIGKYEVQCCESAPVLILRRHRTRVWVILDLAMCYGRSLFSDYGGVYVADATTTATAIEHPSRPPTDPPNLPSLPRVLYQKWLQSDLPPLYPTSRLLSTVSRHRRYPWQECRRIMFRGVVAYHGNSGSVGMVSPPSPFGGEISS
jgi:hypothetical protein